VSIGFAFTAGLQQGIKLIFGIKFRIKSCLAFTTGDQIPKGGIKIGLFLIQGGGGLKYQKGIKFPGAWFRQL